MTGLVVVNQKTLKSAAKLIRPKQNRSSSPCRIGIADAADGDESAR